MLNISLSNQIKGSAIDSVEFQLTENSNRSIISYSESARGLYAYFNRDAEINAQFTIITRHYRNKQTMDSSY